MTDFSQNLRRLFDEAVEIDDSVRRAELVQSSCGGNQAVKERLENLLRAHEEAGGFLNSPETPEPLFADQPSERIGRYKLLQKLGEGGYGVVYMAEQLEPVKRRVALKIIKLGMDSRGVIARFEAERQALALMDHPNIAHVLDAGATETGRPYFVMELVRGIKITDYCDQNNLSMTERLKLFIQVCQAVQHAHQKGIIHRDLKPSNILVASHDDGTPVPKVIDFGIAKATADLHLTDKTLFTRFEMFIGTPAYMSPEQAEFSAHDVDTRTDIYSLGVLLYELLTGHLPFDTETWLKSGLDAMRKAIRETEPTRPSTRLTMELAAAGVPPSGGRRAGKRSSVPKPSRTEQPEGGSPNRRPPTKELIAQLRGDLDWIVLKALEKDRTRRYETANGFARDIQRHLDHEPVVARPPSNLYRFQKSVRRNRPAFAVGAAVALLLVVGIVFSVWEVARTHRVERVQRELRAQADSANQRLTRQLFVREWQDAEQLLENGKTATALAWFARSARDHPDDFAVQTRLLSILSSHDFALPAERVIVHDSPLRSVAFSADENYLFGGEEDGEVHLWPLVAGGKTLTLPRRFSKPAVAAVSPGNRLLVNDAESLSLWEQDGTLVRSIPFPHPNRSLSMTKDRRFVALKSSDGRSQLWDATELRPVSQPVPDMEQGSQVSPDGRYLLGFDKDARVCAWETVSGKRVWQLNFRINGTENWVVALAFHPDGDRIAISRLVGFGAWEVQVWAFAPMPQTPGFVHEPDAPLLALSSRLAMTALCYSPDGDRLLGGDEEGQVELIDFSARRAQSLSAGHIQQIHSLELSASGHWLAAISVAGSSRLVNVRMRLPEHQVFGNGTTVYDAKFSPDSRWFAIGGPDALEIRQSASGDLLHRMPSEAGIMFLAISPDSRRVAVGDAKGRSFVYDAVTGQLICETAPESNGRGILFSPDGRWFLLRCPSIDGALGRIVIRETETGRLVCPPLRLQMLDARFSSDGNQLIVATHSGALEFWSLPDRRRLVTSTARHKNLIWNMAVSRDGQKAVTASRDRTAALWDAKTGERLREFRHDQPVQIAVFGPDGSSILTGDAGGNAHLWDVDSGLRRFTLMPHGSPVLHCHYSRDGRLLITGDRDRFRLWEAGSGLPLSGWMNRNGVLKRAQLSSDGRFILTAEVDGSVRISPILVAPLPAPTWLPDLAESLAGRRLLDDGTTELVPEERWHALASTLSNLPRADFYYRWVHWFLIERMTPKPAPFVP